MPNKLNDSNSIKWYALYTKPKSEKKVKERLIENSYEVYLPLKKTLKTWSDRKKWIEEPIFRSYIFIKIDYNKNYIKTLQTDGVVTFIKSAGKAISIKDKEIENVKKWLDSKEKYEITNTIYNKGENVIIKEGHLKGPEGKIIEIRGSKKLQLSINAIGQALIVEIPSAKVKVKQKQK